jgi:hypothetical protein
MERYILVDMTDAKGGVDILELASPIKNPTFHPRPSVFHFHCPFLFQQLMMMQPRLQLTLAKVTDRFLAT